MSIFEVGARSCFIVDFVCLVTFLKAVTVCCSGWFVLPSSLSDCACGAGQDVRVTLLSGMGGLQQLMHSNAWHANA